MGISLPAGWQADPGRPFLSKLPVGVVAGCVLFFAGLAGCRSSVALDPQTPTVNLTSSSFAAGEIPQKFTCNGPGVSPALDWTAPPPAAASFALIVDDLDAPLGLFVHWIVYNLPPSTRKLPEAFPPQSQLADGTRQGRNDFGDTRYGGPCPPGKSPHRYRFTLYALNSMLNLPPGATRSQVESAIKGHIVARGQMIARYGG